MWKSLRSKARTVKQLSIKDWVLLVEAWWVLPGFQLALRRVPYDRLVNSTGKVTSKKDVSPDPLGKARQLKRMVEMAARIHLCRLTCLSQALTLRRMLGRRGIQSQLRIGMEKTSTGLSSHAWVEVNGESVGEMEDIAGRFKILASK